MMSITICLVVVGWFSDRARLGARARRAGNARRRLRDRMTAIADEALLRSVAIGVLAGAWFFGALGAPLGALGAIAWRGIAMRRRVHHLAALGDEQIPEVMRAIAAGLRAGGSLPMAIDAAGSEVGAPLGRHLVRCAGRSRVGMDLGAALERLEEEMRSPSGTRFVETLRVGAVAGASLPQILDRAASAQDEWARLSRDRRAASAQVRMSAAVVLAMPLVFLSLAGPAARGPARVLLGEPVGWALLALGIGLDTGGWLWMRRLARGTAS